MQRFQQSSTKLLPQQNQLIPCSGTSHPNALASFKSSPIIAALCINFFGMQPTLTQVPPRPHVVPCGVGTTKSHTATFLPNEAAS